MICGSISLKAPAQSNPGWYRSMIAVTFWMRTSGTAATAEEKRMQNAVSGMSPG